MKVKQPNYVQEQSIAQSLPPLPLHPLLGAVVRDNINSRTTRSQQVLYSKSQVFSRPRIIFHWFKFRLQSEASVYHISPCFLSLHPLVTNLPHFHNLFWQHTYLCWQRVHNQSIWTGIFVSHSCRWLDLEKQSSIMRILRQNVSTPRFVLDAFWMHGGEIQRWQERSQKNPRL